MIISYNNYRNKPTNNEKKKKHMYLYKSLLYCSSKTIYVLHSYIVEIQLKKVKASKD